MTQQPAAYKLLLCLTGRELNYVHSIQGELRRFCQVYVETKTFDSSLELDFLCRAKGVTHLVVTQLALLKRLDPTIEGAAEDNLGYLFTWKEWQVIFIPDLTRIHAQNDGRFLVYHFLCKLWDRQQFLTTCPFTWSYVGPSNWEQVRDEMQQALLCAIDIETVKEPAPIITSVAYSYLLPGGQIKTVCLAIQQHLESAMAYVAIMRQLNATVCPKVFQNGRYDNLYFLRMNAPVCNWLYDTYHMMHCICSELPKTLAFISSFYLRNFKFWKEEAKTNLYEYNAKDAFFTLWSWLGMMKNLPDYAVRNYTMEFPIVFPALTMEIEGLAVDTVERDRLKAEETVRYEAAQQALATMTGYPTINPGSPKQMKELLHALGYKQAEGTDDKTLQAFAEAHPLYARIVQAIRNYREGKKAVSTYYEVDLYEGRLLYATDPAGTETGRLASKASSLWCGTQIQNQPAYCKSMYVADPGYLLSEVDNSQSESRCTAYISEDENLMRTVETSPDFHCTNASLFFGIPFSELFDVATGKVLNKPIRTLAKRVNHGANYNMGWYVLSVTMGTKNVFEAAKILRLPRRWGVKQICEHLLGCFDKAYPKIKGKYYDEVVAEIERTGCLVGATGWTRRTFLRPRDSKRALNSAVAHAPQSLSVMLVNAALMRVWRYQLATGSQLFRLKAQIHDSIFTQYREGHEEVIQKISELMRAPCNVRGRTMVIPNDPKFGAKRWSDLKD